jgi:hypothetical protein
MKQLALAPILFKNCGNRVERPSSTVTMRHTNQGPSRCIHDVVMPAGCVVD